jgi:hypothetical protein
MLLDGAPQRAAVFCVVVDDLLFVVAVRSTGRASVAYFEPVPPIFRFRHGVAKSGETRVLAVVARVGHDGGRVGRTRHVCDDDRT